MITVGERIRGALHAALASDGPRTGRQVLVTTFALSAAAFLLYVPSLFYGFAPHDHLRILLDHPELYDERRLWRGLRQIFFGALRREPLLIRDVTWALDSRLFGLRNPLGYHLGNVLLNAANCGLVFLFLLR